jgi:hypothetical protein
MDHNANGQRSTNGSQMSVRRMDDTPNLFGNTHGSQPDLESSPLNLGKTKKSLKSTASIGGKL